MCDARGHSPSRSPKRAASFAKAIAGLQTYIDQVAQLLEAGHLRPKTAQLLTDQANTLIQQIETL